MEIQSLKLLVTEQDLNDLLKQYLPDEQPLENVTIRVAPEGIYVSGEYPLFVRVAFETLWEPAIQDGKVSARLASLKAMGLPATLFKSTVLKVIEDAVEEEAWLTFDGDVVVADVGQLLAGEGIKVKTNLRAVRCQAGELLIEGANA